MNHSGTQWTLMIERHSNGEEYVEHISYIEGNQWGWAVNNRGGGGLIDRKDALDLAIERTHAAEKDITTMMRSGELNLPQEQVDACKNKLAQIREGLVTIYGPVTSSKSRETEEAEYRQAIEALISTIVYYSEDIVSIGQGGAGPTETTPEQTPESPTQEQPAEPNLPKRIEITGFPFNDWELPTTGTGRRLLDQLSQLPDSTKTRIRITHIEGHTDKVPVRRGSKRFKSLEELSDKRANAVRAALGDKFETPPSNILKAASEAGAPRRATHSDRAKDRKVVIEWEWKESTS
jgi:outer membrane protein OmpA-like peptidoglycan-associated protein